MKKTTSLFFVILILASTVTALDLRVDAKEKFTMNETIQANFTLEVDEAREVGYISSFQCSTIPVGFPERKTVNVPEEGLVETKVLGNVTQGFESQKCNFTVSTTSPEQVTRKKTLNIVTDPKIDLELLLCEESDCENQSKTFKKGKTIYLDYSSNAGSPEVSGTVSKPDGSQLNLNPPQQVKLDQKGTYSVQMNAEDEGYRTTVRETRFAAIDEYSISYTSEVSEGSQNTWKDKLPWVGVMIGFIMVLLAAKLLL